METTELCGLPLSFQQANVWPWQHTHLTSRAWGTAWLQGPLNRPLLRVSVQELITRHEILRTQYQCLPAMTLPVQVIDQSSEVAYPLIDLRGITEQELVQQELVQQMQRLPWQLERGPVVQFFLIQVAAEKHLFYLGLPAVSADFTTISSIVQQLGALYDANVQALSLPDDEYIQYTDFALWQREMLEDEEGSNARTYWKSIAAHLGVPVSLPFAYRERTGKKAQQLPSSYQSRPLHLTAQNTALVNNYVQRHDISLEIFLLTCWCVLLWRLTGEENISIGVACNARVEGELTGALGPYTRNLPFITHIAEGKLLFSQVLTQVDAVLKKMHALNLFFADETLSKNPQRVSFACEHLPAAFNAGKIDISFDQIESYNETFDLKLACVTTNQEWQLALQYDPACFPHAGIEQIALMWDSLIQDCIVHPDHSLTVLNIVDSGEQEHLLQIYTQTHADYPQTTALIRLFEAQVAQTPEQVAVVCGASKLTYQQLNAAANRLAHHLRTRNISPDTLVGLFVNRSVEMIIGLLAILKTGGAYIPFEPDMPTTRLIHQINETRIPLIIAQKQLWEKLPMLSIPIILFDAQMGQFHQEPETNIAMEISPESRAYVLYTSGSTGTPKGVEIRQQSLVNYVWALREKFAATPGMHFATVSTLTADLGNTVIFSSLISGGCLHIMDYDQITSGEKFATYTSEHTIDVLKIVPSHLQMLLSTLPESSAHKVLPRQHLVLGGEAFSLELLERIQALDGTCRIYNHYGPTETTIGALFQEVHRDEQEQWRQLNSRTVPLGRPLANVEVYLLDAQQHPVPRGITGEIYIGGCGLAKGYLKQPELTRQRFVPHPLDKHSSTRVYRTGDLARYLLNDEIEFLGRADTQIKLRGYRVEIGEIEACLAQYEMVRESVVVLRSNAGNNPQLWAYVVPQQSNSVSQEQLRDLIRKELPDYMVPSMFYLVQELPLTNNGKVDRRLLQEIDEQELPQRLSLISQEIDESKRIRPRDNVETQLVDMLEELLLKESISVLDDFFDLGGNSMIAVHLMSMIKARLDVDMPLSVLFERPTIEELAMAIREQSLPESWTTLVPIQPKGTCLPFFCVHPSGGTVFRYNSLAHHLGDNQPFYGLQPPEFSTQDTIPGRLEDLVQYYISEIRRVQPEGPYLLSGWSLGGIIALEIARQLLEQGQEIGLLAIIDSSLPLRFAEKQEMHHEEPEAEAFSVDDASIAQLMIEDGYISLANQQIYQRPSEEQLEYVWQQARQEKRIPQDMDLIQFRRVSMMRAISYHAVRTYLPYIFSAQIVLISSAETIEREQQKTESAANWEQLTSMPLQRHVIPGKHTDMFDEPNVREMAQVLQAYLDKANNSASM